MSSLPETYTNAIQALEQQVRQASPPDILQFCADFFDTLLKAERAEQAANLGPFQDWTFANPQARPANNTTRKMANRFGNPFGPTANSFGGSPTGNLMHQVVEEDESGIAPGAPLFSGAFGGDASTEAPPSMRGQPSNTDSFPAQYNFGRRTSVSAESLKPSADPNDSWTPPFHEKTPEQIERLHKAIEGNFLFSHLDERQTHLILGALVEKPIPAKDIKVISQGDAGDYFYIVEKGSFDVHVNPSGSIQSGPDGLGEKVGSIDAGGSFGELALMYNAPRAATIISSDRNCMLWALDRLTFRRILMESTFARRRMFERFLGEVPLLKSLTDYERSKIADALETQKFSPGETIIKEGDPGHSFYLLESGEADAFKGDSQVLTYRKGDYFGELALLNDTPRAASIRAKTDVVVATLNKNAFRRLLGPVEGFMRRTRYQGVKAGVEEMDPLNKA